MSINKSEQTLEDKLINDMKDMARAIREIKSKQPIGSDVLSVEGHPSNGPLVAGPYTVLAGNSINVGFTTELLAAILTLWNFAFTIYVDVHDSDHAWPSGNALTATTYLLDTTNWIDWASSNDTTGSRRFNVFIKNRDSISHDYYIALVAYLPAGAVI